MRDERFCVTKKRTKEFASDLRQGYGLFAAKILLKSQLWPCNRGSRPARRVSDPLGRSEADRDGGRRCSSNALRPARPSEVVAEQAQELPTKGLGKGLGDSGEQDASVCVFAGEGARTRRVPNAGEGTRRVSSGWAARRRDYSSAHSGSRAYLSACRVRFALSLSP